MPQIFLFRKKKTLGWGCPPPPSRNHWNSFFFFHLMNSCLLLLLLLQIWINFHCLNLEAEQKKALMFFCFVFYSSKLNLRMGFALLSNNNNSCDDPFELSIIESFNPPLFCELSQQQLRKTKRFMRFVFFQKRKMKLCHLLFPVIHTVY